MHPGVDLDLFRPARRPRCRPQPPRPPAGRGRSRSSSAGYSRSRRPTYWSALSPCCSTSDPALRERLVVPVVGGPSGSGLAKPEALHKLAARLGRGRRRTVPARQSDQERLADWYRAATVLVMPSYSESFGLVAIEAQACGTPVVAAAVGGLPVAVRDGDTGFLVPGHDPRDYAKALRRFVDRPQLGETMGAAAAAARAGLRLGRRPRRTTAEVYARGTSSRARAVTYDRPMAEDGTAQARRIIEQALREAELTWECPRARHVRHPASGHPQAVHHLLAGRRPAHPVRERLRRPPPRREPRGVLPLAAGTQRAPVRGQLRDRLARRRLPDRPAAARRRDRGRGRPAAGRRGWRTRTAPSTPCWSSASPPPIRKEYAWRVSRGESTRNLDAFTPPDRRRRAGTGAAPGGGGGRGPGRGRSIGATAASIRLWPWLLLPTS